MPDTDSMTVDANVETAPGSIVIGGGIPGVSAAHSLQTIEAILAGPSATIP